MPSSLFKYMRHPGFLENLRVPITPPNCLNDAYEFRAQIRIQNQKQYIQSIIERNRPAALKAVLANNPNLSRDQVQTKVEQVLAAAAQEVAQGVPQFAQNTIIENASKLIGVLSLTEDPTGILMWGHYAAAHCGYVVEFDPQHQFFQRSSGEYKGCGELKPVDYSPSPVTVDLASDLVDIPVELFYTKQVSWSYEREWRLLRQLNLAIERVSTERGTSHLIEVPKDAVKSIIFGCRRDSQKIEEECNRLRHNAGHLEFKKSDLRSEGVRIIPL